MEIYATWNIDVDDGRPIGVDDGTMPGDAAADDPWDFGTDSQYPVLRRWTLMQMAPRRHLNLVGRGVYLRYLMRLLP